MHKNMPKKKWEIIKIEISCKRLRVKEMENSWCKRNSPQLVKTLKRFVARSCFGWSIKYLKHVSKFWKKGMLRCLKIMSSVSCRGFWEFSVSRKIELTRPASKLYNYSHLSSYQLKKFRRHTIRAMILVSLFCKNIKDIYRESLPLISIIDWKCVDLIQVWFKPITSWKQQKNLGQRRWYGLQAIHSSSELLLNRIQWRSVLLTEGATALTAAATQIMISFLCSGMRYCTARSFRFMRWIVFLDASD